MRRILPDLDPRFNVCDVDLLNSACMRCNIEVQIILRLLFSRHHMWLQKTGIFCHRVLGPLNNIWFGMLLIGLLNSREGRYKVFVTSWHQRDSVGNKIQLSGSVTRGV
jgi:hypothetical protein